MQASVTVYVGLGANLSDPKKTIVAAISVLNKLGDTVLSKQSSFYRTKPIDAGGDDYINAVVELQTKLSPAILLQSLQEIEQQFGRVRPYQNAPRTLDCDLLLYGQQIIHTPTLIVPHPRMHQRAFVLIPLLELDPNLTIPAVGPAKSCLVGVIDQEFQKIS